MEENSSEIPSDDDLAGNSNNEVHVITLDYEAECKDLSINLVALQDNIQDAEKMEDSSSLQNYCPLKCSAMVNDKTATMVMDTGAGGSVVSCSYLQGIDSDWESKISVINMGSWKGYGSTLQPRGIYTTGVVFINPRGNLRCQMSFVVMDNVNLLNYFIIGINNIRVYGIKINVCQEFFTIEKNIKRHFSLQCFKTPAKINSFAMESVDESSTLAQPDIGIGKPTLAPKGFKEGLQMANWDDALGLDDKEEILKVIHQFPMVFAHGQRQLGSVNTDLFDINLTVDDDKHPPCLQKKAYPASPQRKKDIEANLKELLDHGVIEPVEFTPRNAIVSPVFVGYQGDKARLCGDFRALNDYNVSDIYAIPQIDSVLHNLKGAKRISVLDGVKGYHQLCCTDRASNYLHIITHCGVYKYKRMPFGPKNGPSAFQRLMDRTFTKEIREGWLSVYIDDIIVHSDSNVAHVDHLRQVFTKLEEINMTLSFKKCRFAHTSVQVLGHIVSGLLMSVDLNKVKAIMAIPPPVNVGDILSFLGMCGHYRQ